MLILGRKLGQRIIIDGDIVLEVVEITRTYVKLGFTSPTGKTVYREELLERMSESGVNNLEA